MVARDEFDAARVVVRVRRAADLSQRDLAAQIGLTQSGVADIESGRRQVSVAMLSRILRVAGLRLCVVDGSGAEVSPFDADAVRDNGGRRFPAHLDVLPPDQVPELRWRRPRYDRQPAKAWYHRRGVRDVLRSTPEVASEGMADHPTVEQLERRRRDRHQEIRLRAKRRAVSGSSVWEAACECEADCWTATVCSPQCPCQCEPVRQPDGVSPS